MRSLCTSRSPTTQNVVPGFAFPTVGRLGITSPPSRRNQRLRHRYYAQLRLPKARLVKLRFMRLSSHGTLHALDYLCPSLHFLSRSARCSPKCNRTTTPGLLINRYTSASGYSARRQMALPSSQATPMCTCPGLRPRRCPGYLRITHSGLLPSTVSRASAFIPIDIGTYP